MADVSLGEVSERFLQTVKGATRQAALAELNRFGRWYGPDKPVTMMRGHDVATYGELMGPATPETTKRAEALRLFLDYLKAEGLVKESLKSHLRLKKSGARAAGATQTQSSGPPPVELTAEGVKALEAELESLKEQRLHVREDIKRAMMDKDFRENSPLDAAKDRQGHIEARIREIESMMKRIVVVDGSQDTGRVRVGCVVTVRNADNGKVVEYSIVGPTEANAGAGKISSVSPVGKALLGKMPGDEVEVSVPAGTMKLVVEAIKS